MDEDGYYFSVHELQVLMAVRNVRVEAYNFKPGVEDSESLEPLVPEWLEGLALHETVRVVREGDGKNGGHFSRL